VTKLDCASAKPLIDRALDGELTSAELAEFEEHRASCADCAKAYDRRAALIASLRKATRHALPENLRQSLVQNAMPATIVRRDFTPRGRIASWSAASAALAASLTFLIMTGQTADPLPHDLAGAHIRSLMPDHLMDVASSDHHTVKPWFNGRFPGAPPVPELASDGFPLAGGRLDYVGERMAAVMVYRRNQHVINLFAWPAAPDRGQGDKRADRNGFHEIFWSADGMNYAAVSDLNWQELVQFQSLWQAAAEREMH
jgi:anti-sigma factor RsiW